MKIAITGSNGRLGYHVARHLIGEGHEVIGIGRQAPNENNNIQFRKLDLRTPGNARIALSGSDAVVHLAAISAPGFHQNEVVFSNNTSITYNVLEAAFLLGIRKVIVSSSIAVLGCAYGFLYPEKPIKVNYFPVDEAHPLTPIDAYGMSKYVDEIICSSFALRSNMEITALRFSWVTFQDNYLSISQNPNFYEPLKNIFWSYTDINDVNQSISCAINSNITGFNALYITSEDTLCEKLSIELIRNYYPDSFYLSNKIVGNKSLFSNKLAFSLINYKSCFSWKNYE